MIPPWQTPVQYIMRDDAHLLSDFSAHQSAPGTIPEAQIVAACIFFLGKQCCL
jgi:hypothetical protein